MTHNKSELIKIAEESKPLHENMDDWIKLRQFYSILFLEFENEFYKERNKELEQEQKNTTEKRKQVLLKARQTKKEIEKLIMTVKLFYFVPFIERITKSCRAKRKVAPLKYRTQRSIIQLC